MNKDQLIQTIKELQAENPEIELTRKTFRSKTDIKDSVWEKHFGNFTAFKQVAGIVKTKTEKKLLQTTAKHASVDHLRAFDEQKAGWEGKYLKPSGERFQTILTGSDQHDLLCCPFYRRLFVDTARRAQPNKIILAGDLFDLYEFSRYTKDIRKMNILGSIQWVDEFLRDLRAVCPDAEIVIVGGNHEARLMVYLSEQANSLLPILSDLHGFTVPKLLGLEKHEVNYVSRDSLAVFSPKDMMKELGKNYYVAYDCVLFHHFPYAKDWGMAGVNGHHHSHTVEQKFNIGLGRSYEWHQLGSGHIRAAEYCEGEKWSNGFALIHVDTHNKYTQIEYFDTTNNHCVIGGQWYTRNAEELLSGVAVSV